MTEYTLFYFETLKTRKKHKIKWQRNLAIQIDNNLKESTLWKDWRKDTGLSQISTREVCNILKTQRNYEIITFK